METELILSWMVLWILVGCIASLIQFKPLCKYMKTIKNPWSNLFVSIFIVPTFITLPIVAIFYKIRERCEE